MHKSVLLKEAIDALHIKTGAYYIDATLGAGGHSIEIIKRGGKLLAFEADERMLNIAKEKIQEACSSSEFKLGSDYILVNENFRNIVSVANRFGFNQVSGILFDLGISSMHLDSDTRGFSFKDEEAVLDMRLSPENQMVSAADLLNSLPEAHLEKLFSEAMNKNEAKKLAHKVSNKRVEKKFSIVGDLLDMTGRGKKGKIHSGTKAFMALRMAVNSELETLKTALVDSKQLLKKGGVMVVISFHSGEDKVVKEIFEKSEVITPDVQELSDNRRARSAKMRIYKND